MIARATWLLATGIAIVLLIGAFSTAHACDDYIFLDRLEEASAKQWPVGVRVTLLGKSVPNRSVTLGLNGETSLSVDSDGTYCFDARAQGTQTYEVSITAQPELGASCAVTPASGVALGPVVVEVSCSEPGNRWNKMNWESGIWQ